MVLGADGGVATNVADDAAADLPRPRLGRWGCHEHDGESETQLEEEGRPARESRGRAGEGGGFLHYWRDTAVVLLN